jgi:hypothetical protein
MERWYEYKKHPTPSIGLMTLVTTHVHLKSLTPWGPEYGLLATQAVSSSHHVESDLEDCRKPIMMPIIHA